MCYGMGCLFEDSMGECRVSSKHNKCQQLTGHSTCFIGGVCEGEESAEEYNRLAESGEIGEMIEVVNNIGKRRREED